MPKAPFKLGENLIMTITTQNLAGVKEAVKCYWDGILCIKVEVKNLTKRQILRLLREWEGWTPVNATPFYHNETNYRRLLELANEGKIKRRECDGWAFEIIKKGDGRGKKIENNKQKELLHECNKSETSS